MLHREREIPPDHIYPVDRWRMVEKAFYPRTLPIAETIFSVANGYLGMRGNFEEDEPAHQRGTFINGFHETWPIVYGESAYGFAKTGQTMINVPDAKVVRLYVDDEPFYLPTADLKKFERVLDMKNGVCTRRVVWETPAGKQVEIRSGRMVSFLHRHLALIYYDVTLLNADAPVVVSSCVSNHEEEQTGDADPRKARGFKERVLEPRFAAMEDQRLLLGFRAKNSRMSLGMGVDHAAASDSPYTAAAAHTPEDGRVLYTITGLEGKTFSLSKFVSYHTSRRSPAEELCERAGRTLDRGVRHGRELLLNHQRMWMDDFWKRSDIQIQVEDDIAYKTSDELQQTVRFNLFHLAQASARAEGTGIPAKGLTGQTYEGHYFWDTEIYVAPFLMYTAPRIARNLLEFRYSMLEKARKRAAEVNQQGALFPWRTINGDEASAYYAAGTAQYHINADIMYALKKYVEVTGDASFLLERGAEMLVETARLWCDLGFFSEAKGGKFVINEVTGPDEYNTVVNNNAFTNLMARGNLRFAAETVNYLKRHEPKHFKALKYKTGVTQAEAKRWKQAADNMYVPMDETRGIIHQDDEFMEKEPWDFENTPIEKYPLLLHYHPLVIYRYQVVKQADVVLALFLLGDEFTQEEKRRNFDFYDPLTTGDSSLSVGVQSIIAMEVGHIEKGMEYGRCALLMDLADIGGNVSDGVHVASMGACWMAMVNGIAGMRDHKGHISFCPHKLEGLVRLAFPLKVRGRNLYVTFNGTSITYELRSGDALSIRHHEEKIMLSPENPIVEKNL